MKRLLAKWRVCPPSRRQRRSLKVRRRLWSIETALILPLADVIDLVQERARLGKECDKLAVEIRKLDGKLSNEDFVRRAPPEVVEEQRERKAEMEAKVAKLKAAQQSLAG